MIRSNVTGATPDTTDTTTTTTRTRLQVSASWPLAPYQHYRSGPRKIAGSREVKMLDPTPIYHCLEMRQPKHPGSISPDLLCGLERDVEASLKQLEQLFEQT